VFYIPIPLNLSESIHRTLKSSKVFGKLRVISSKYLVTLYLQKGSGDCQRYSIYSSAWVIFTLFGRVHECELLLLLKYFRLLSAAMSECLSTNFGYLCFNLQWRFKFARNFHEYEKNRMHSVTNKRVPSLAFWLWKAKLSGPLHWTR